MQHLGFYVKRKRWIVATSWVIWPALILVSMIYCNTTLDRIGGLGKVRITPQKDSSSNTRDQPKDKLLGGLLSPDYNDASCLSRYQSTLYRRISSYNPSPYLISRLRNYESLHRRCGPHTKSYNKTLNHLHRRRRRHHRSHNISNNNDCKYIVHLFMRHSGIGNRMLSLTSSFLFAVLTNRVLLIDQGHNTAALLCNPFPNTTWALPFEFPLKKQFERFNQNSSDCYGNMMKKKTIELSMDKSPPPFVYLNLIYDYNEYDKRFFCDRDQDIMNKVPWLIMRSDQYFIPSLFLIPSFEGELRKLFPEKETVFHHLGRYLFHPSNQVWGLITRYYEAYLAKSDERIGIQIRDFNSTALPFQSMKDHIAKYYIPHLAAKETIYSHDVTKPLTYMMDRILNCSVRENLLPKLKTNRQNSVFKASKNPKTKSVLVTSLNSWYFEKLRNMYWENPTINGESIGVFQPSHEEFQQNHNPTHNMKALAEVYLLSLMDELITSPWSTFGYVAQGLGGLKPWILNNPEKEMDSDSSCRRAISMEPCFHFPPSYDCEAKTETDNGRRVPYVKHCEDTSWGIKLIDDYEL